MLDRIAGAPEGVRPGKVLKMVENPRMAGSVPAWVKADSATDKITRTLADASIKDIRPESALAYQLENAAPRKQAEEFTFYDLLDMVNPLQHIPLVNIAYRKLTGDEIKGAPLVIGGAIFGGPVGAAAGIANVIVKEETGKDFADNTLAFTSGEKITWHKNPAENTAPEDLPVSLLAFTNTGTRSGIRIERQNEIELASLEFSPYEIY